MFQLTNPFMVTFNAPDSPVAEQYRKLKTLILQMTRDEFRNTVLVTSAVSGEGKSLTCANLAVMLAREYAQTVLLIDADLRRPSLQTYLGMRPLLGLSDCLEDRIDVGRAIMKAGLPKLSFLAAGRKVANPSELLSSYRMKEFIEEVKNRYRDRYIIIDTPPALLYAETQAMSALVDGVVAVVREGAATLKDVRDMMDILKGTPTLAVVFNDVSSASLEGSYYSSYEKYYKRHQENP